MANGYGTERHSPDIADQDTMQMPALGNGNDPEAGLRQGYPAGIVAPIDPVTGRVIERANPFDPTVPMPAIITPISGEFPAVQNWQEVSERELGLPQGPRISHPLWDSERDKK